MADYFDLPFYYVFDASGLTDGQSYAGLSVPIDGDAEFLLRAVLGLNLVIDTSAGSIYLYDGEGRSVTPSGGIAIPQGPLIISPEIPYPAGGQIRFNLSTVQKTANDYLDTSPRAVYSRLVFAGVKRFRGAVARALIEYQKPKKPVKRLPYAIRQDLSVSITSHVPPTWVSEYPPQTLRIELENHDFELYALSYDPNMTAGTDKLLLMPYDASGRQLASEFVPSELLVQDTLSPWTGFPCQPLFFEANSFIRFDWVSRFTDTDTLPATVVFTLIGASRRPC